MLKATQPRTRKLWILLPSACLLVFLSIAMIVGWEFSEPFLLIIGTFGFMATFGLLGMIFER